jgi:hypothetical protein
VRIFFVKEKKSRRGEGDVVCGRVKKREGEIIKSICGNLKFQPDIHQKHIYYILLVLLSHTDTLEGNPICLTNPG